MNDFGYAWGYLNYPGFDFSMVAFPRSVKTNTKKQVCGCNKLVIYTYEPSKCNAFIKPIIFDDCVKECAKIDGSFFDRSRCLCTCLPCCCPPGYAVPKVPKFLSNNRKSCECMPKFKPS